MDFLYFLNELRTPFLDRFFLLISQLGGELLFTVIIVGSLWCFNKKAGFWMFFAWIFGSASSQFLKVYFAVPRPWVRDASFSPVEEAIAATGGYSFPSGHTQSAASLFGSAFLFVKSNFWRVVFVFLTILTGFSRMYLGVHTPADVLVGLLTGILPVFYVWFALKATNEAFWRTIAQTALLVLSGGFLAYVLLSSQANDEFFLEGLTNAWKLAGASLGLVLSWRWDQKRPFETSASWPVQIIKCFTGGAMALCIKFGLKTPLLLLFDGHEIADGLRYFLLAVFAFLLWPMTFRFWQRIGKKPSA